MNNVAIPVGAELTVNTQIENFQFLPNIIRLQDGRLAAFWIDSDFHEGIEYGRGLIGQILDSYGNKIGGEFIIETPTGNANYWNISATTLESGDYVLTWSHFGYEGNTLVDFEVKAQLYNLDGTPKGGVFQVNTETLDTQFDPVVTPLKTGGFVVAWQGYDSTYGIKAQIFNASGGLVGQEFLVNTETFDSQNDPTITTLSGGGFVVAWVDNAGIIGTHDFDYGMRAQIYDASGAKVGENFPLNIGSDRPQTMPSIAALAEGGFVAVWSDRAEDGSQSEVRAQIFSETGQKLGADFIVNTTTVGGQWLPVVASLDGGGFVVSWYDGSQTGGDNSGGGVKAQVFAARGQKVGPEFLVNTTTQGSQSSPNLTSLPDNGFIVSWVNNNSVDGVNNLDIKAQIFSIPSLPDGMNDDYRVSINKLFSVDKAHGVLANDIDLTKNALVATLATSTSHGHLTLNTDGSFIYNPDVGFSGDDAFSYYISNGTASDLATVTLSVSAQRNLFGTADADTLTGDVADDTLNGWLGADLMTGGSGDDTYYVDNLGDKVVERTNEGIDTVKTGISYTLADNVENLTLIYNGRAWGTGNGLANVITGNDADNVLRGQGGGDSLYGRGGNDTLDGGAGADTMFGGVGDDIYYVDSSEDATIELPGEGVDTVRSGISVTLGDNVENLEMLYNGKAWGTGNSLGNTIVGNANNNVLRGMDGNDTLIGGFGADAFVFNTRLNAQSNLDSIVDFRSADNDAIWLDDSVFKSLSTGILSDTDFIVGTAAVTAFQHVIYDSGSGKLYYDADGAGGSQQVQFASVTPHTNLSASQFLVI